MREVPKSLGTMVPQREVLRRTDTSSRGVVLRDVLLKLKKKTVYALLISACTAIFERNYVAYLPLPNA